MRKIFKKNWKSRRAVSPVIATILMVAITVVLAAVLYVMVMGFNGSSSNAPTASMTATGGSAAHSEMIKIDSISSSQSFSNMKLSLVNGSHPAYSAYVSSGNMSTNMSLPNNLQVSYISLTNNGKVSSGDYVVVTDTNPSDTLQLNLVYVSGSTTTSIASASWTSS